MALINTSVLSSMTKGVANSFNAVGKTLSAAAILGEGFADQAQRYNEAKERDGALAAERETAVATATHKALMLEQLAIARNQMTVAKELATAADLNASIGERIRAKATALTDTQLDELAKSGIDITDPKAMRKYLMGSSTSTSDDSDTSGELSLYDQLIASN